ncbi:MAG TPA: ABC transporter permease, partial [Alphaproteobacteria bacterium]|nr:ABC transporter permease [Alphaproteobacteria bacterium]
MSSGGSQGGQQVGRRGTVGGASALRGLAQSIYNTAVDLGGTYSLLAAASICCIRCRLRWAEFIRQLTFVGWESLPVILLASAFAGMVLAVQSYYQFSKLTVENLVGLVVALSMGREIAPLLTALVLTSRVGAAMAAELGTMSVTEQVDAVRSMGVDPVAYLVAPRFAACVVMMPVLTVFTNVAGIAAAAWMSIRVLGVNSTFYFKNMKAYTDPWDITSGLIKAFFFGMIIASIACYHGLAAKKGAEGVGKATTATVVGATILV